MEVHSSHATPVAKTWVAEMSLQLTSPDSILDLGVGAPGPPPPMPFDHCKRKVPRVDVSLSCRPAPQALDTNTLSSLRPSGQKVEGFGTAPASNNARTALNILFGATKFDIDEAFDKILSHNRPMTQTYITQIHVSWRYTTLE